MKGIFKEYYEPTEDELKSSWESGLVAFDANTLLNLYRYKKETNDSFFSTLRKIEERLWIPYQAAYEFHNNRLTVIDTIRKSYDAIRKTLEDSFRAIESKLNEYKDHPTINKNEILSGISEHYEGIKRNLQQLEDNHPDFLKEDSILNQIGSIITDDKIGNPQNDEDLKKIYSEGSIRYQNKIPPGYADEANKKNKGNRSLYGDLIIWHELINKIKKEKQPIIFVTDDRKEDWWTKHNGEIIRPREELIKEFYDSTGIRILIYTADRFLKYAKERLALDISDAAIEDVKNVRTADETILTTDIKEHLTYTGQRPFNLTVGDYLNRQPTYQHYEPNNEYIPFRTNLLTNNLNLYGVTTDSEGNLIFSPTSSVMPSNVLLNISGNDTSKDKKEDKKE